MMKDNDLKRNASGYYDETCYKGITAPPKAGEVWVSQDGRKTWLILQNHGTVCSTLLMGTEEKENSIKVMARVPMYTDPTMVGYTFTDYVSTFVKTIPVANLAEVRMAVGKALGIMDAILPNMDDYNAKQEKVLDLCDTVRKLEEENKALIHENALLHKELDHQASILASNELAKMAQEMTRLEIYKDMYMNLIDKLVAVRGGTVND